MSTAKRRDAGLHRVLGELLDKLRALPPGGIAMVPGGWRGQQSVGWVVHLVERSADGDSFALTTANAGQGIEYHLAKPGHDKTKYRTCLRLEGVAPSRLLDPGFWAVALSQWARGEGSEFARVEVLYDVLLPWLADGPLLPTASGATTKVVQHQQGEWRSAARSGAAGAWKCGVEAVRYQLLRSGKGFTRRALKKLTTELRTEMLARSLEDLATLSRLNARTATSAFAPIAADVPAEAPRSLFAVLSSLANPNPAADTQAQQQQVVALPTCGDLSDGLGGAEPVAWTAAPSGGASDRRSRRGRSWGRPLRKASSGSGTTGTT